MKSEYNENSFEFFRGRSLFTSAPIVGLVCCDPDNRKTGPLAQTYILAQDVHPVELAQTGSEDICGGCLLQKFIRRDTEGQGGCYVNHGQGPASVWKSWQAGRVRRLEDVTEKELRSRFSKLEGLRYGAYGEPVAIPRNGWTLLEDIVGRFSGNIRAGYTHAWREARFQSWRSRLMASVETGESAWEARQLGWRYFRTGTAPIPGQDILCPASDEFFALHGYRRQCHECGACSGAVIDHARGWVDSRRSIYIPPHGRGKAKFVTT